MRRSVLTACALALTSVACGGTYHPPIPDQAVRVPVAVGDGGAGGVVETQADGTDATPVAAASAQGRSRAAAKAVRTGAPSVLANSSRKAAEGGVIRIGGVDPLSGPIGSIGRAFSEGIQSVFAQVNEQGGIGGARIEYHVEDDQFDPVVGKKAVEDLIEREHVFAFAGIFNPATVLAAQADIDGAGTPLIPTDAAGDTYNDRLFFPPTQSCPRELAGNVSYAVQTLHKTKLAFIYLNYAPLFDCVNEAMALAVKLGATVTHQDKVEPTAPDCASQVLQARQEKGGADFLFVLTDNLGVIKCVKAARDQQWNVGVSISHNIVDDPTLFRGLGDQAEGLYSATPFTGAFSAEFEAYCGQAIRRYFPDADLQYYHLVGCTGAHVFVSALRALGPNATRAQFVSHLEGGRVISTGGMSPDITYHGTNHTPYDLVASVEVKNGRWVRVTPLFEPPRL